MSSRSRFIAGAAAAISTGALPRKSRAQTNPLGRLDGPNPLGGMDQPIIPGAPRIVVNQATTDFGSQTLADFTYISIAPGLKSVSLHWSSLTLGKLCVIDLYAGGRLTFKNNFMTVPNLNVPPGHRPRPDLPNGLQMWSYTQGGPFRLLQPPAPPHFFIETDYGSTQWAEYWANHVIGSPEFDAWQKPLTGVNRTGIDQSGQAPIGANGARGTRGPNGRDGAPGVDLQLVIDHLAPTGSLWIITDGEPGYPGSRGGDGQLAGGSTCGQGFDGPKSGGTGGDGAQGGDGGKGGDTSHVLVTVANSPANLQPTSASIGNPGNFKYVDQNGYSGWVLENGTWPSQMPVQANGNDGRIVIFGTPGPGGPYGTAGAGGGGSAGRGGCGIIGLQTVNGGPSGNNGSNGKLGASGVGNHI